MAEQKHLFVHKGRVEIFINNFIGGIAWGLGATVGVSLLITVLGIVAAQVGVIPVVGTFVSNIISFVLQHNQYLQK
jgi:hypothetical protein